VLPADASAADGASCFVNPLTALGMVETMKREGHTALVHTAAASNLGQMLNRICLKDGIALVNIVRKPEQAALLREQGARHVCDLSAPGFMDALTDALAATGATIAFDAIGGGKLAGRSSPAWKRRSTAMPRSTAATDRRCTSRSTCTACSTPARPSWCATSAWPGAWAAGCCSRSCRRSGRRRAALRERVAAELKTTFASHYTRTVSLAEALSAEAIAVYAKRATGEKFLIDPSRG
jgi:NADPH:quinone reductase